MFSDYLCKSENSGSVSRYGTQYYPEIRPIKKIFLGKVFFQLCKRKVIGHFGVSIAVI